MQVKKEEPALLEHCAGRTGWERQRCCAWLEGGRANPGHLEEAFDDECRELRAVGALDVHRGHAIDAVMGAQDGDECREELRGGRQLLLKQGAP